MAAPLLPNALPEKIGRYRIDGRAGAGGMGVVLRAFDTLLERPVALKVLGAAGELDVNARGRLIREAKHLASLQHEHVVSVYDAGEEDGVVCIAMRWVDGPDLEEVVAAEGALDPDRAVAIVEQVASALDAAHADGLVHRDVKPANVLLCAEDGHALLTDFGLTTGADVTRGITADGDMIGTPDYASPEQIEGAPVDHRADVYALGGVLHRLVSGEVPYPRDNGVAKLFAHVNDEPPALPAGLPHELGDVVARAMAKDPGERFASAGALAAAARAAVSPKQPTAEWPAVAATGEPRAASHSAGGRRRRPLALAGVLATFLVVGLAAAFAFSPRGGEAPVGAKEVGADTKPKAAKKAGERKKPRAKTQRKRSAAPAPVTTQAAAPAAPVTPTTTQAAAPAPVTTPTAKPKARSTPTPAGTPVAEEPISVPADEEPLPDEEPVEEEEPIFEPEPEEETAPPPDAETAPGG